MGVFQIAMAEATDKAMGRTIRSVARDTERAERERVAKSSG